MPARNRPLDPAFMDEVKAKYSEICARDQRHPGGMPLDMPTQRFDEVDEDEAPGAIRGGLGARRRDGAAAVQ